MSYFCKDGKYWMDGVKLMNIIGEKIKIGSHMVIIKEADPSLFDDLSSKFVSEEPAIYMKSRIEENYNVGKFFYLNSFFYIVLYGIAHYSNIEKHINSEQNNILRIISNGLFQVIIDNPKLLTIGVLPDYVKISGIPYKVNYPCIDTDNDGEFYGKIDYKRTNINIFGSNGSKKITDISHIHVTLWHEIVHGIFSSYGFDRLNDDESVICTLSEWIVMVIVDNQQFMKSIFGEK